MVLSEWSSSKHGQRACTFLVSFPRRLAQAGLGLSPFLLRGKMCSGQAGRKPPPPEQVPPQRTVLPRSLGSEKRIAGYALAGEPKRCQQAGERAHKGDGHAQLLSAGSHPAPLCQSYALGCTHLDGLMGTWPSGGLWTLP